MGSLAGLVLGHAARAQDVSASPDAGTQFDRQRTIAVSERVQVGYEEMGRRIGDIVVYPRLRAAASYEDNVRARSAGKDADLALLLEPSVRATSDWARHQIGLYAAAAVTRFATLQSENTETFTLQASGRYEVDPSLKLYGFAGIRRDAERRSAPGALRNSVRPAVYQTQTAGAQLTWQTNRLRIGATANAMRIDYEDVVTNENIVFNSRNLDRSRYQFGLRADYALNASLAVLVSGTWGSIDYNPSPGTLSVDRSAAKAELLAGLSFEFTDFIRGEVAVGHVSQNFKSPSLKDFSGFGGRAQIEYFPTRLTTVQAEASRTLQEAGNPLAPTYTRSRVGLKIDHELYRYLVLSLSADYENDRFQLPNRKELRRHVGSSGQFLLNRNVTLFARYDHLRVTSRPTTLGRRLTDNVISAGLTLKL